jgi:predicted RND superfamily exporter protein
VRDLYFRWVLGRPWIAVVPVLLLATYLAVFELPDFRLEAGSSTMVLEGDDSKRIYDETRSYFTDDDYVLVAIQPPEVWTPAGVAMVGELTADLEGVDGIESVLSPANVHLFLSRADGKVDIAALNDPEVDLAKAREELTTSEVYVRNVISDDGTKFNLLAYLSEPELIGTDRSSNENVDARRAFQRRVINDIRDVLAVYRDQGAVVHASGLPTFSVDMVDYIEHDIAGFGLAVAVFLFAALFVFFRKPRFVLLPLLTCILTVVTVMGLMVVFDVETTVVTSNISSLLFIVGMAHSIHIVVAYREERGAHPERAYRMTLLAAVSNVWKPCLYTALTTCVGFASLLVTDVGPVKQFGVTMACGTLLAFTISLVFLPAALSWLPPSDEDPPTENMRARLLARCAGVATLRRGPVYIVALAALAAAGWGMTKLRVDTSFIDYFVPSTEVHQGIKWVDQVGGTMTLEVILPGGEKDYWIEPANYAPIVALHDWFDAQPEVGKTMSLVSVERYGRQIVTVMMPAMAQMQTKALFKLFEMQARMRGRPEAVAQATSMVLSAESVGEGDEKVLLPRYTRVQVRIKETTVDLRREAFLRRLDEFIANEPTLEGREPVVTGMFQLFTRMLETVVGSQVRSFGLVFAACAVMLVLLMRSVRAGALMMIPNLLPIALVLGPMGAAGITLDIMTITIASVSLGIAVDSAIHYVTRFRREVRRGAGFESAVFAAHQSIGRAVLYTALTVIAGFLVLTMSRFTPTIYFGTLVGVAMVTGLVSNLVLLPALLMTFRPFRDEAATEAPAAVED